MSDKRRAAGKLEKVGDDVLELRRANDVAVVNSVNRTRRLRDMTTGVYQRVESFHDFPVDDFVTSELHHHAMLHVESRRFKVEYDESLTFQIRRDFLFAAKKIVHTALRLFKILFGTHEIIIFVCGFLRQFGLDRGIIDVRKPHFIDHNLFRAVSVAEFSGNYDVLFVAQ